MLLIWYSRGLAVSRWLVPIFKTTISAGSSRCSIRKDERSWRKIYWKLGISKIELELSICWRTSRINTITLQFLKIEDWVNIRFLKCKLNKTLQHKNVKKFPSGICCWNSNSQHHEDKSPPTTTRHGRFLKVKWSLFECKLFFQSCSNRGGDKSAAKIQISFLHWASMVTKSKVSNC